MSARRQRRLVFVAFLVGFFVVACGGTSPSPEPGADGPPLPRLDLQLRNSGLRGGYLWLAITGGGGRWHQFGMAEFICVTCAVPFGGSGESYEIAVLDETCQVRAVHQAPGGQLLVEIDLGPKVTLVQAPPLGDWMPVDSAPADPSRVPCYPP